MENAWYYMALQSCKKMALLLNHPEDLNFYETRLRSIEEHFHPTFWNNNCYYYCTDNHPPDDRANALAVLAGLAKPEHYEDILKVLSAIENSSPYMEKYVLDALCEMGYIDEAIHRIKRRYKEMVEEDYSTLWEFWDKSGTMNHAWSGGPLITMAKYIAGIRPAAIGYQKTSLQPHLGNLRYVKCTVATARGEISVDLTNSTL
jgi:glycogen debranching enzyme